MNTTRNSISVVLLFLCQACAFTSIAEAASAIVPQSCSVTAGRTATASSFTLKGSLADAGESNFVGITDVYASIDAGLMPAPIEPAWPVNATTLKRGVFSAKGTVGGAQSAFKFDSRTKKFSLELKNANLTGMACPVTVEIQIGTCRGYVELDETIVNGTKPCPASLLMGVQNALAVTKCALKGGTKPNSDSVAVSGTFSIDGAYDAGQHLTIVVGAQSFTVPAGTLSMRNNVLGCTNAISAEGPAVTAKFDMGKCTFTVTISKATIEGFGLVDFGVNFPGVGLLGLVEVDLGPQRYFSFENELRLYNARGAWWEYDAVDEDRTWYTLRREVANNLYNLPPDSCSRVQQYYNMSWETNYYCTNDTGTYLRELIVSGGDFEIELATRLQYAPPVVQIGQSHTAEAPFTAALNVSVPGADVSVSNLSGTIKMTGKVGKWERVNTPLGPYTALRVESTLTIKGTMNVEVTDHDSGRTIQTTGTVAYTLKETVWCVPGIGIVQGKESDSATVTARGAGSLTDKGTESYSISGYSVP